MLGQQSQIPSWIKNTAKWWGEGKVSDSEFISALQWLIDQKILVLPKSGNVSSSQPEQTPKSPSLTLKNPLLKYLPNITDLPFSSLWTIQNTNSTTINAKSLAVNGKSLSFKTGIERVLKKESPISPTSVIIDLYKFTFVDDAGLYFQDNKLSYASYGSPLPYTHSNAECIDAWAHVDNTRFLKVMCRQASTIILVEGQGTDIHIEKDVWGIIDITLSKVPYS